MCKKATLRLFIVKYYKESILKIETINFWAYEMAAVKRSYILSDKSIISIKKEENMGIRPVKY